MLRATGIAGRACTAGEAASDAWTPTGAVGGSRCPPGGLDRTGAGVIAGTGVIVDSGVDSDLDGSCGLRFHMIAKLNENVTTIVRTMERL
jgi:hypothetical protein